MSMSIRWIWLTSTLDRSSRAASIAACSNPMHEYALTAIRSVSHRTPRPL